MLRDHYFDPDYEYSSKFLKKYLLNNDVFKSKIAMDIPSGNGRNIFLLASYFKHVFGIDISKKYLSEIEEYKEKYNLSNIETIELDIMKDKIEILPNVDFICISHLYSKSLYNTVKSKIKTGGLIYIETPTCRGGNFLELPSRMDIDTFLNGFKVLYFKENICKSDFRFEKGISFTSLIEKEPNGINN